MSRATDARQHLRAATAADHERVDRAFSQFDLADRGDYGRFLLAQAEAFLPLEAAINQFGPLELLPDWLARRRSDALIADLQGLGLGSSNAEPAAPIRNSEEMLGTIYVLEGSRLGGRMLARSVPVAFPHRFLCTNDAGLWRSLIEVLDKQLISDDQHGLAIDAARRAFAMFEAGALRHQGTTKLG